MCGRFALSAQTDQVEKLLPELYSSRKIIPNYNISPNQEIAVILNNIPLQITYAVWGLIPFWSQDIKIGQKMINARAESLNEKPSFKNLLLRKRCLIPADGFYEWKQYERFKYKIPYFIKMKSAETMTFAGLWDEWHNKANNRNIISTIIITTPSNEIMSEIHHRMPAIILPEDRIKWLQGNLESDNLSSLLNPIPSNLIDFHQVSSQVNSPMTNDPSNIMIVNELTNNDAGINYSMF